LWDKRPKCLSEKETQLVAAPKGNKGWWGTKWHDYINLAWKYFGDK